MIPANRRGGFGASPCLLAASPFGVFRVFRGFHFGDLVKSGCLTWGAGNTLPAFDKIEVGIGKVHVTPNEPGKVLHEELALPKHERAIACASGKVLAKQRDVGYTHNMQVLHSDNRKRVTLPDPARPKDSWIPEVIGPNQIVLTRVEKPARPRAKLVRKNGLLLLSSKRPISWEETRKAMDEFP